MDVSSQEIVLKVALSVLCAILNTKAVCNYMYSLFDIKCIHRQPVDFP